MNGESSAALSFAGVEANFNWARHIRWLRLPGKSPVPRWQVPYYDLALDVILDSDSPNNDSLSEEQHEVVETAAEMLYGLIHVRYILTARGMAAMHEKLKKSHFGTCPRVLCAGQSCLPIGTSDIPRQSTVKVCTLLSSLIA